MVNKSLLAFFTVSAIAGIASSQVTCTGPYQETVECANPCNPSCDNPNQQPCPTFACSPGCACQEGAILSSSAEGASCILKENCPKTASCTQAGEVAVPCGNPCQPSCKYPKRQPCPTFACTPGCACQKGYLRLDDNPSSPCVPSQRCAVVG